MAKQEEIKLRVTAEEKSLIREAAKLQGVSMSKFILDCVVPTAEKKVFDVKHKEIVEDKVVHTEQQLQELKKNWSKGKFNIKVCLKRFLKENDDISVIIFCFFEAKFPVQNWKKSDRTN